MTKTDEEALEMREWPHWRIRQLVEEMPPRPNAKPITIDGALAYVPLSRGLVATIDADDAAIVGKMNWHARSHVGLPYAQGKLPGTKRTQMLYPMHRLVFVHEGRATDHINGNPLDNRKANLRPATFFENAMNKAVKPVGVSYYLGAWNASITINKKKIPLGRFRTAEEAHLAYLAGRERLLGKFATVPPPPPFKTPTADELARFIRVIDGSNSLGAGQLAERIVDWMSAGVGHEA